MHLGFASAAEVLLRSEGDQGCIFFTLNTYQTTFISYIFAIRLQVLKLVFGRTEPNGQTNGRTDGQTNVEVEIVI